MQQFLGNPESGLLNLEAHHLALAIAMKTLDENHLRTAQKTMDREPPSLKIGVRVYLKNNETNMTSNGDLDTGLSVLSMTDITYTLKIKLLEKTRSCNAKDIVLEPQVEFWNICTQFGKAGRYIIHPANLPTIMLND